ncbi:MAG: hypothetical protein R3313_04790 [Candidatus Saccharimonadales bacterium]|nr:hypothetical protein [Candidatus Saccharimonadales bacterium]
MQFQKKLSLLFAVIITLAFISVPSSVLAERSEFNYGWTKSIESTAPGCVLDPYCASTLALAVSPDHGVVAGGYFAGQDVNFNPDGSDLRSTGAAFWSVDAFIARWDVNGNYQWTKTFGDDVSGSHFDYVSDIQITDDGSLIAVGGFRGTVNFNPDGLDNHTAVSGEDTFVSKWSLDGTYQWTLTFGGVGAEGPTYVDIDSNGNIFIFGEFNSTNTDFDPGPGTDLHSVNNAFSAFNLYLTKLDSSGTHQWTKTWGTSGSTGDEADGGMSIANGAVYVGGSIRDGVSVNYDPDGSELHTPSVEGEAFVNKWTTDGVFQWTRIWDVEGTGFGGAHVAAANDGSVYVGGTFGGANIDLDPTAGTDLYSSNSGSNDMFLTKLDSSGAYQWSYTIGGTTYEAVLSVNAVTDNSNFYTDDSVYIIGETGSLNVDFDPTAGVDLHSAATEFLSSVSITRLNADGSYGFSRVWGGGVDDDYGFITAADENRDIYIGGYFASPSVNFNPDGSDVKTTGAKSSAYIAKWTERYWQHVTNLDPDQDTEIVVTEENVELGQPGVPRGNNEAIRLIDTSLPIADIGVDFPLDNDWSTVISDVSQLEGKSLAYLLDSAPGTANSFTFYVPRLSGYDTVGLCPQATTLQEVGPDCSNLELRQTSHPDVSIVNIDGNEYWQVLSVTDTGGFNYEGLAETGNGAGVSIAVGVLVLAMASICSRASRGRLYRHGEGLIRGR